jgi:GYF domain 2
VQIFIKINGVTNGPFLIERVKQMLFTGQVTPTDQAFIDGQTSWIPLSQVPGLQDAFSSSTPNQEPQRRVSLLLGTGILFLPFVFSWFTLQRGYSMLAKAIAFSWLGLTLMSFGIQPLRRGSDNNRESSFAIQPVVTMSKYQQLQNVVSASSANYWQPRRRSLPKSHGWSSWSHGKR